MAAEPTKIVSHQDEIAKDRADFVRRLFAVAISIGFAAHISQSNWLDHIITRENALLLLAMVFVVSSWDGYLRSLRNDPLTDMPRFVVDVVIVFEYLILMQASGDLRRFQILILIIFGTYILWDYLKLFYNREKYGVGGTLSHGGCHDRPALHSQQRSYGCADNDLVGALFRGSFLFRGQWQHPGVCGVRRRHAVWDDTVSR
jgi:hypothetical protein